MNKKYIISVVCALMILGTTVFSASPSPSPSPSASPSASQETVASPTPTPANSPESSADASESPEASAEASASPSASPAAGNTSEDNTSSENSSGETVGFPEPHCEAAILIDRKSGDILYEKNKSERLYPASTTKIMTGILALENGTLTDYVTATQEAISPITNEHSHMGIKVGETLTLEQLLYGMLVYSANDAANVIAVHIAGSLSAFADMMNQKAQELGLSGTHFTNAHGFHDDNHYTTAEDLAILTKYAMQNEKFCEIVNTGLYRIPANEFYTEERVLSTTNHLISRYRNTHYFYKYAIGVKTGSTGEAGNCLVAAATKDDIELISVILKADESQDGTLYSFADTTALFEYAFNNYQYCQIAATDDVVSDSAVYEAKGGTRVALSPAETIEKLLPVSVNTEDIKAEVTLNEEIKAPIAKGDVLGSVTYTYQGEVLATSNLVASNDVEHDKLLAFLHLIIKTVTSPLFFIPVIIIIILIIISNNKRKQRRKKRRNQLKYANQPKRKY